MTDIIIQQIAPEGYSHVEKLFTEVYEKTFRHAAPGFAVSAKGEAVYTAQRGAEMIGMMTVWEPTGFIHYLFVDENARGTGVGTALLQKAKEVYGGSLSLKCLKKNQAALAFYLHRGWVIKEEGTSEDGDYYLLFSD